MSGPAAGVIACGHLARAAGFPNVITGDMGGTSFDVSLIANGESALAAQTEIDFGMVVRTPMIEITTIGAGGGSIARVDRSGLLQIGPESAGADPGPVCYGLGNTEPTVTDANVVLQTLNPEYLLGGRMKVDQALARDAIARLADKLGMDVMATAQGIISVVTANMAKAIRVISVQRGHDPRDYTLVAFGGAGPVHAARLAKELDMSSILVPRNPGILCAMGLLLTDLRADFASTRLTLLEPAAIPVMAEAFAGLDAQAEHWFARLEALEGRGSFIDRAGGAARQQQALQVDPVSQLEGGALLLAAKGLKQTSHKPEQCQRSLRLLGVRVGTLVRPRTQ